MKKRLVFFILLSLTNYCFSQKSSNNSITAGNYEEHLMHYFENKNDDIIHETINIYQNSNYRHMLDTLDQLLIFFFYGIKIDNTDRYNNFLEIINNSRVNRLINIFEIIENNNISEYLDKAETSPDLNDVYWALFFSSGNTNYLDRLFHIIMDNLNETENPIYYIAMRTALWSIASNMEIFPQKKEHTQRTNILSEDVKQYLFNNNYIQIDNDTREFVGIQRQKGRW